jgi:hypothetical protein
MGFWVTLYYFARRVRARRAKSLQAEPMTSTIEKGNTFRDLVASMLEAASFVAETETREHFKKVDVRWRREDLSRIIHGGMGFWEVSGD